MPQDHRISSIVQWDAGTLAPDTKGRLNGPRRSIVVAVLAFRPLRLPYSSSRGAHGQPRGDQDEVTLRNAEYKSGKKERDETIRQKARCWQELINDANRESCSRGCKVLSKKLDVHRSSCSMEAAKREEIVQSLFPVRLIRTDAVGEGVSAEECALFTAKELEEVVLSMKDKQPPEPDGIPSEVLKLVCKYKPNSRCVECIECAELLLFDSGCFSLPLGSCGNCAEGKLLERLIKPRERAGDYSPTQYGFRVGPSTIDAIEEVVETVKLAGPTQWPLLTSGALFYSQYEKRLQFCEVMPYA